MRRTCCMWESVVSQFVVLLLCHPGHLWAIMFCLNECTFHQIVGKDVLIRSPKTLMVSANGRPPANYKTLAQIRFRKVFVSLIMVKTLNQSFTILINFSPQVTIRTRNESVNILNSCLQTSHGTHLLSFVVSLFLRWSSIIKILTPIIA